MTYLLRLLLALTMSPMNAATAALIGAGIGFLGNALMTWINKHFDELKARRELMIKTAWDYYSKTIDLVMQVSISKGRGGDLPPLSIFVFHTVRTVDLALRKNLSNEEIAEEMRKIEDLNRVLKKVADDEQKRRQVGDA